MCPTRAEARLLTAVDGVGPEEPGCAVGGAEPILGGGSDPPASLGQDRAQSLHVAQAASGACELAPGEGN